LKERAGRLKARGRILKEHGPKLKAFLLDVLFQTLGDDLRGLIVEQLPSEWTLGIVGPDVDGQDGTANLLSVIKAQKGVQFGAADALVANLDEHVVSLVLAKDVDGPRRLPSGKANAVRFLVQHL